MNKISYIQQMNAFIDFRERDCLSGNATILYLSLFREFNRTKWQFEWLPFSIRDLMYSIGTKSSSNVVLSINILKSLGYIETKTGSRGRRSNTEFRLIPLYNLPFMPNDMPDADGTYPEGTATMQPASQPCCPAGTNPPSDATTQQAAQALYTVDTYPDGMDNLDFCTASLPYAAANNVPSSVPSAVPTPVPSAVPTPVPSTVPTSVPSTVPSSVPTPVPSSVPTSVPSSVPTSVPSSVPSAVPTSVPRVVPTPVPKNMPQVGTLTACEPLQDVASRLANKKKREEKKKSPSASTHLSEGIQPVANLSADRIHPANTLSVERIHPAAASEAQLAAEPRAAQGSYSPTEAEFHLCIDTYNVCINQTPSYEEKMQLVRMARQYSAQSVIDVLGKLYETALQNPQAPAVLAHQNGKPHALGIKLEACEKILMEKTPAKKAGIP